MRKDDVGGSLMTAKGRIRESEKIACRIVLHDHGVGGGGGDSRHYAVLYDREALVNVCSAMKKR